MKEFITFLRHQKNIGIDEIIVPKNWKTLIKEKKTCPDRNNSKISQDKRNIEDLNHSLPNNLEKLEKTVSTCVKCKLSQGRTQTVFGVGNPHAELMFIGEAPGRDEDLRGEPFVGRAGQLLTKIITAMGYKREDIYIANVVKCRPPQNRGPFPIEVDSCMPYLLKQIELIKPKIIVGLGSYAVKSLLSSEEPISKLRGRFFDFHGVKLMATFHPAYLLRNPNMKKLVWEDMQQVMAHVKEEKK